MEIYNATGKTKTGTLRVTKSIGALLFMANISFSALANEKITAHIERANGSNEEIATNIPLSSFIASSVFGDGLIIEGQDSFSVLCEICNKGALKLAETETIVISLTDLKSTSTYQFHGIEMPIKSNELIYFTEKIMLSGQKNRVFDVSQFESGIINGDFQKVRLTYATDEGNSVVEFTKLELRSISADMDLLRAGSKEQIALTPVSLVGVTEIEIFSDNQVSIVLRDVDSNVE